MSIAPKVVRPVIITVHGTFAGVANAAWPHWWQTESQLAREIEARFGAKAYTIAPFVWKDADKRIGPNRESERQRAGAQLLDRMLELEAKGIEYHLIGHSHGGSVIWHALTESALRNRKLAHLKTWASIATPFICLGSDRSWWRNLAGAVAVLVALYWMGFFGLLPNMFASAWQNSSNGLFAQLPLAGEIGYIYDAVGGRLSLGLAFAFGIAAAFFLTLLALPFFDLFHVLYTRRKHAAAEQTAAQWYESLWLGLAHPHDEAISGLKATLIRAPNLVLRPRRGLAFYLRGVIRPLFRPIDEFAWTILMRNAQGCDIRGLLVRCVGPAPVPISAALRPLPADVAHRIEENADADAAGVLARFRDRLETISNQADLEALAGILTGTYDQGSLIHTTMFADEWVCATVVDHISGARPRDAAPVLGIPAARVAVPERAMPVAKALAAVGAVAVITVMEAFAFRQFVYPETNLAAAERILEQLDDAAFRSIAGQSLPGEALVRASRLGTPFPRVLTAACKFNDAQTMAQAYQLIYRDLAARGQDEELNKLISPGAMKRPQSDGDLRPLILTAALEIMAQRERRPDGMGQLSQAAQIDITNLKGDQRQIIRQRLIPVVSVFEDPATMNAAARTAVEADSTCNSLRAPLESAAALANTARRVANLDSIVLACAASDQTETTNRQRVLRRIAVGALPSCQHAEKLLAQSSVNRVDFDAPVPPRFLECLAGAGRREAALKLSAEARKWHASPKFAPVPALVLLDWRAPVRDFWLTAQALRRAGLIEEAAQWTKLALERADQPVKIVPEIDTAEKFANDAAKLEILRATDPKQHRAFLDALTSESKKAEESQTANQFPETWIRLRKIHAEQIERGAEKACTFDKTALEYAATMIEIFRFDARIKVWSALQSVLAVDDRCSIQMNARTYERLLKVVSTNAKPLERAANVARFAPFRPTLRQALVSADRAGIPEEVLRGYVSSIDRLRPSLGTHEDAKFAPLPYPYASSTFTPQMCDVFARN